MKLSDPYRSYLLFGLLFISGFAGLGYEIIWTRTLSAVLGHEMIAVLAVVSAFFSGLALGAWALDRPVARSLKPDRWYAALEAAIGTWALVLAWASPWINSLAYQLLGSQPTAFRHWAVAFLFPFAILLPATLAMGGTLPAMERIVSRIRNSGCNVGGLYAVNTLGAVGGTLATTLLLAPRMGFMAAQHLLAGLNILCAMGVLVVVPSVALPRQTKVERPSCRPPAIRLYATLFATGLLGIGYELIIIRVLSQTFENTVYSFSAILSVYLLGTAVGAAAYQIYQPKGSFNKTLHYLLLWLSLVCLMNMFWLHKSSDLYQALMGDGSTRLISAFAVEGLLAAMVFFLPTFVMGATFSHLAQAARRSSSGFGYALSINTLGASLAAAVFSVLLLPHMGLKWTLLILSLSYLLLSPAGDWRRRLTWLVPVTLGSILAVGPFPIHVTTVPVGGRILSHADGVTASVTVVADAFDHYHLKVNNHFQMGGTTSSFSDYRQAHIPLLLHSAPKEALFLGLGTGATFTAAAAYNDLRATAVELVPEVVEMLPYFETINGHILKRPQMSVHIADARRYVRTTKKRYDVIVADLFHPSRDGAGFLYTVEHFRAIRRKLTTDGIFCQWLPIYQLDMETLQIIIRTFLHVFPEGSAYLAHFSIKAPMLGLVASKQGPILIDPDGLAQRMQNKTLYDRLRSIKMNRIYDLFGCYLADQRQLSRFASYGPINTDDRPVVMFNAPRFTYTSNEPPHKRLIKLIEAFDPQPEYFLQQNGDSRSEQIVDRMIRFWQARKEFIHAGADVPQTRQFEALLRYVRKPLLAIVRKSPEFDAAYTPLLSMAHKLHATDPEGAEELLDELESANPLRDDARRMKQFLRRR